MFKGANDLFRLIGGNRARSLYVFNLDGLDILRQLRFEEFIYRNASPVAHNSSFFLVNGSHIDRSVVFGLSGNPSDFVKDLKFCWDSGIKLIKRFSGGGTVLIDENTVTSSFIGTHSFAPSLMANQICQWTFDNVYSRLAMFNASFALVDGDFVVRMPNTTPYTASLTSGNNSPPNSPSGDSDDHFYFKVGGNAQAFSKHSFVHHTCFVWQVSPLIDKVLLIPRRMPKYRRNRDHGLFLQSVSHCLTDTTATRADFSNNLRQSINFNAVETFSFKYRPLSKVDDFELNDDFFDDCVNYLNKPTTNQLTF